MLDIGEETAAIARISTKVSEEDPAYCKMEGDTALHKTEEGMSMSMSEIPGNEADGRFDLCRYFCDYRTPLFFTSSLQPRSVELAKFLIERLVNLDRASGQMEHCTFNFSISGPTTPSSEISVSSVLKQARYPRVRGAPEVMCFLRRRGVGRWPWL